MAPKVLDPPHGWRRRLTVMSTVTFINAFELPGELDLDDFTQAWRARAEHMRAAPGFRDARMHRAVRPNTRFPIVNIAHWDAAEQVEAAQGNPAWRQLLQRLPAGAHANPGLYRIVHDFPALTERESEGPGVTFMNIFEIAPDAVDDFAESWAARARLMQSAPGFRNVLLHRALSPDTRFQLVNVAQWDSLELWQAATEQAPMQAATTAARAQATPNAAIYRVAFELN